MSEGAANEPAAKLPFEEALLEVVKTLHKDPVLVYGIGAGIILVAALAFTTSLAIVLVVAGVLIAVLIGRILMKAQAKRSDAVVATGTLVGARHDVQRVANVKARTAADGREVRTRGRAFFLRGKKAEIGNIELGGDSGKKG